MNKKLIKQIKAIQGVKTVEMSNSIENMVIATFEPKEPVLHDEYGVPIFAGDDIFFVVNWTIKSDKIHITSTKVFPKAPCFASIESAQRWIEENKPKPIYTDPETGDEFFDGDNVYMFSKRDYFMSLSDIKYFDNYTESKSYSKIYKSREKCEIAVAEFIASKYDKKLIDNLHLNDENN